MFNSVYIDAGGHGGQSIERFKKMSSGTPNTKIYSFECHPRCYEKLKIFADENIIVSNKAVWIQNGEIDFYLDMLDQTKDRGFPGQASTISKTKMERGIDGQFTEDSLVKVPCIDFSEWIKNELNNDDYIFLKMDIEGSEYEVLNKMIDDGTINYLDDLDIEFHWHKIGLDKKEHDALVERLHETDVSLNIRTH
jgi:FkbM family methyltransferase